tara:strand:- start:317 stop:901 length:585 start_codon:yes stop_codon:yes gene_type:complete
MNFEKINPALHDSIVKRSLLSETHEVVQDVLTKNETGSHWHRRGLYGASDSSETITLSHYVLSDTYGLFGGRLQPVKIKDQKSEGFPSIAMRLHQYSGQADLDRIYLSIGLTTGGKGQINNYFLGKHEFYGFSSELSTMVLRVNEEPPYHNPPEVNINPNRHSLTSMLNMVVRKSFHRLEQRTPPEAEMLASLP